MLWWTLRQLKSKSDKTRSRAAEKLGNSGNPKAVEPLIAALKDSDWDWRWYAAEALEKIGAAAVLPLIAVLNDSDCEVRWHAVKALGKIGDERAVEPLIATLKDKINIVRHDTAEALGRLGDGRAIEPLIAALNDADLSVRHKSACALVAMKYKPPDQALEAAILVLGKQWDSVMMIGFAAIEPLIASLRFNYNLVWGFTDHGKAGDALGKIGAAAVLPLIAVLNDSDFEVRWRAVEALGKIGDERAVAPLIAALGDSNSTVTSSAVNALGEIGAIDPLIAALKDSDCTVREVAAAGLGHLGDTRAIEPLIEALNDPRMRRVAASALGRLGGTQAAESLFALLEDSDNSVRLHAASVLKEIRYAPLSKSEAQSIPSSFQCVSCSETIDDFHYDFESIILAAFVGCQCLKCGRALCAEHSKDYETIPFSELKCSICEGTIIWISKGPAYSSMVYGALRSGRYNEHIRPPLLCRGVFLEPLLADKKSDW